jgi:hypothetical protein
MSDERDDDFDRTLRALHARAIEQVPSRTLYELRVRRANAAKAPARLLVTRGGWWLAAASAAVFALALGLRQPGPAPVPGGEVLPSMAAATEAVEIAAYEDGLAALDEDPDLYLWLAAQDSQILAME